MSIIFRRFCLLSVLLCAFVAGMMPADLSKYTGLINKVSGLPSARIVEMGDASLSRGRAEEALVLYMVVCDRSADDMAKPSAVPAARPT